MGKPTCYGSLLASAWLLCLPCPAAAAKKPAPAPAVVDLAGQAQKHGVDCPLPKMGPCVIKKPVGTRYRVLTPAANLEDIGDFWLADFTKLKDPKVNRMLLRVLGENGDLHEIEARFPPDPAAKVKPAPKEEDKPKEAPKEAPKEGAAI